MKVVHIVPTEMRDVANTKMSCAYDWTLQRWNEEGKNSSQDLEEDERFREVDPISHRDRRSQRTYDDEEQEEEVDDVDEEEVEPDENILVNLGESEEAEEADEESDE